MPIRGLWRRLAFALPVVIGASVLPVISTPITPKPRTWAVRIARDGVLRAPAEFGLVGVTWLAGTKQPREVRVRTQLDGRRWTGWEELEIEPDAGPDGETALRSTTPLWVGNGRSVDVRFTGGVPKGAAVRFVDPGPDPTLPASSALASPGKPAIVTRAQWGADESIRRGDPLYAGPLKLAIVHHTATGNNYSASESKRIVRSIYTYHVQSNGWNDIGYNFLIDRYGQIFEGRYGGVSKDVVGAHAKGFNRFTSGMSVIGTFDSGKPPAAAMKSLTRLASWRLDQDFVDPRASTTYTSGGSNLWAAGKKVSLRTISAHRDVGRTACPGNQFYSALVGLRDAVHKDGQPKLYAPARSTSVITPNGDGFADSITLKARFGTTTNWRVDILDPVGVSWKKSTGTGTSMSVNWNGKKSSGQGAPHDKYRMRITGKNTLGQLRTVEFPVTVFRYPNGTFFRTSQTKWSAILLGGKLRHPSATSAINSHYRPGEVVYVTEELRKLYPAGSPIGYRDGSVVRVGDSHWVISGGRRRPITRATMDFLGYQTRAVINTTSAALAPHPTGSEVVAAGGYPNGTALQGTDLREALVVSGQPRPFVSQNVRLSRVIRDVDLAGPADAEIAESTAAEPVGFRDGTLIQSSSDSDIYLIADGLRRRFSLVRRFSAMGYKMANVRVVSLAEMALHAEGPAL